MISTITKSSRVVMVSVDDRKN